MPPYSDPKAVAIDLDMMTGFFLPIPDPANSCCGTGNRTGGVATSPRRVDEGRVLRGGGIVYPEGFPVTSDEIRVGCIDGCTNTKWASDGGSSGSRRT